jgi:hypothetical protein
LNEQYNHLDPVALLEKLKKLQSKLFEYAWCSNDIQETVEPLALVNDLIESNEPKKSSSDIKYGHQGVESERIELHHYRHTKKKVATKAPGIREQGKILLIKYGTKLS